VCFSGHLKLPKNPSFNKIVLTWMLVPALAGSTPSQVRLKGSATPRRTDDMTMRKSEEEMAVASLKLPLVAYTRTNPAAARPVPSSTPTPASSVIKRRMAGRVGSIRPVAWQYIRSVIQYLLLVLGYGQGGLNHLCSLAVRKVSDTVLNAST
jgi:hypothetical protein